MLNSKLISALKTLDNKEFRRFGEFIESPFFNTNPTLIKLYIALKNCYPAFSSRKLKKEEIFKKLYPESEFKDGTLRNLVSDMSALLQKFLVQIDFESDRHETNLRLLKQLDDRRIDTWFNNLLKESDTILHDKKNIGYYFFDLVKQLEDSRITFALNRGLQKSICQNVLKRSEYNVYNFIINLLVDLHDLKINQDAYNAEYEFNISKEIAEKIDFGRVIEVIERTSSGYSDILKLFIYEGLAFLKIEEEHYYFQFKRMFFENYDNLSYASKDNLFTSLENICIEKIFHGKEEFIKEQFDLFKERLNRKDYKDETGNFNLHLFRNMVLTAVSNNEIVWLEKFLEFYLDDVAVEFRNDMKNFVSALICFEKMAFPDTLNSISKLNDKADIFKYTANTLKLKVFYEMDELDSAEHVLDSYTHYINQSKAVSERFRKSNKDFLKSYQILLRNKFQKIDLMEINHLKELIINEKYFKEKIWLLRKIAELENKK